MNKQKDFSKLNEETYSTKEWYDMIDSIRDGKTKIPYWVHNYFLNALPPIYVKGGFLNPEPIMHTNEGALYYFFYEIKGSYFAEMVIKRCKK